MTHTQGEWKIMDFTNINNIKVWTDGVEIASLPNDNISINEWKANAKLIAAAPELLEALMLVLPHAEVIINDNHLAVKKAKAAIAKATGNNIKETV